MTSARNRLILAAVALSGLTACTHTDPVTGAFSSSDGPFFLFSPIRLTWSLLAETEPAFTPDGKWITYVYERENDRDRCIGVMPAGGGARRFSFCAWELNESSWRDGLSTPALGSDGRIIFTRQFGKTFALSSDSSGLYLGNTGSSGNPEKIFSMPFTLPGSARSWMDLIGTRWLSDDELITLAARRIPYNGSSCKEDCPKDWVRVPLRDTLKLGIEIARLKVDGSDLTLLSTFPATNATTWSFDAGSGAAYFVARTTDPVDETFLESTSDTLYRVVLATGVREAVVGYDRSDDPPFMRIEGVAAGQGRVFISRSWPGSVDTLPLFVTVPPGTPMDSGIFELMSDGSQRLVATLADRRWGAMAISPDGRSLVAEALLVDGSSDLYLMKINP